MKVRLRTRLGQNRDGSVVELSATEAQWLFDQGLADPMPLDDADLDEVNRRSGAKAGVRR